MIAIMKWLCGLFADLDCNALTEVVVTAAACNLEFRCFDHVAALWATGQVGVAGLRDG